MLGAPKLSWVEFNITYTTGLVNDNMYDDNGQPDWKHGLKYYVEDICVRLWKCPRVNMVSFINREKTGKMFGNTTRWFESWRDSNGWGEWEEKDY